MLTSAWPAPGAFRLARAAPFSLECNGSATMLTLDGSRGEGGGQVLRTALSLAAAVGRPVRIARVRGRRARPGLQPQHLAVVQALAQVADAEVRGDALDSTEVTFVPRGLHAGDYRVDVGAVKGSAGAVSLVFQAMLLPLVLAGAPSRVTLVGGTHVPWSPPFPYLVEAFLPAVAELGVRAQVALRRWGWYPAGGGEIAGEITPAGGLRGVTWTAPPPAAVRGVSAVSRLPREIAERQQRRVLERLAAAGVPAEIALAEDGTARGPGTIVYLGVRGRAGFSALGRRGVPAERVADEAVGAYLAFRAGGGAVDEHLPDQLVPLLALAGGPSEVTCPTASSHLRTVASVVEQMLPVGIAIEPGPPARVRVAPAGS
jgi:RNA 3'-terminal phosphate cyclase (ATP)